MNREEIKAEKDDARVAKAEAKKVAKVEKSRVDEVRLGKVVVSEPNTKTTVNTDGTVVVEEKILPKNYEVTVSKGTEKKDAEVKSYNDTLLHPNGIVVDTVTAGQPHLDEIAALEAKIAELRLQDLNSNYVVRNVKDSASKEAYRKLIEAYKIQNPVKYARKEAAFKAKLATL